LPPGVLLFLGGGGGFRPVPKDEGVGTGLLWGKGGGFEPPEKNEGCFFGGGGGLFGP